jgi:hypothetical protein
MKLLTTIALAAMLAGCAMPATTVTTGSARPALAVQGAPAGAILYVDGLQIGDAARYDGKTQRLMIEDGAHRVEIRQGGAVLHTQQIFAGPGETATVVVGTDGAK